MRTVKKRPKNGYYPFKTAEGITIEQQVRDFINGSGSANFVRTPYFPDKTIGVAPETDIRTDMHEIHREVIEVANNAYMQAHQMRLDAKFAPAEEVAVKKTETTPPPSTGEEN